MPKVALVLVMAFGGGLAQAATQVRTSIFAYDAQGLLQHEVVEPTDSNLCVATDYGRDAFGNITSTTVRNCNGMTYPSAAGNAAVQEAAAPVSGSYSIFTQRQTTSQYESLGRFPNVVTNATGVQSETRLYDPRWGSLVSLKGPNGLATSWTYDVLGHKTQETRADSTSTSYSVPVQIASANGVEYYQVTTTASGQPTVIQQFDQYDRPVCGAVQPFSTTSGAAWNASCKQYDILGRVVSTYVPFATAAVTTSPNSTTAAITPPASSTTPPFAYASVTYDVLGRVTKSVDVLNNITTTSYNGLSTTVTDAVTNAGAAASPQTTTTNRNAIGQVVEVEDPNGMVTSYGYDAFGNVVQTNAGGVVTNLGYDLKGRKISMTDPDMGGLATPLTAWTYAYDAIGELVRQWDAKGQVTMITYDVLGRMFTRSESDLISYWEYDKAASGCAAGGAVIGKLDRAWTSTSYARTECYDPLGRAVQESTTIGTTVFTGSTGYDSLSRVQTQTYPTGFKIQYNYNANGYLSSVTNVPTAGIAPNAATFWTANALDPAGHVTQETLGNGLTTTRGFYANGLIKTIYTGAGSAVQNESYAFDPNLNLHQRTWYAGGVQKSESFHYDALNRLNTVTGPASKTYQYDALGNLISKSDIGTYSYPSPTSIAPHRPSGITGTINGVVNPAFSYDANGNEMAGPGTTITWTSYNMASSVTVGQVTDSFLYGPEHQRVRQVTGTTTTYYVSAQQFEQVVGSNGTTNKHYIYAGGALIAQVTTSTAAAATTRYFHKNHQGSTVAVTNETGGIVEAYSYDAWGKRRNLDGTDGAQSAASYTPDYTGQEAMDNVGLVNMNGRIYNPTTGQFVSADPLVQAPGNLQSYNRYAYVWNNPLTMTDRSGFCGNFFSSLGCEIGNLVDGAANGIGSAVTTLGHSDTGRTALAITAAYFTAYGSFGGVGVGIFGDQSAVMCVASNAAAVGNAVAAGFVGGVIQSGTVDGGVNGALSAALFFAAGSIANGSQSLAIATHAVAGCASAAIAGGNCGNGAIAAAVTQAAEDTSTFKDLHGYNQIIAAAVVGGTASALSGGKFANGAFTGAYGYLFNYCSHDGHCTTKLEQALWDYWPGYRVGTCITDGDCTRGDWLGAAGSTAMAMVVGPEGKAAGAAADIAFQTSHYADRLVSVGLDVSSVESTISGYIAPSIANLAEGANFWGRTTIDGVLIEFRARLQDGIVRVGTIFPVK